MLKASIDKELTPILFGFIIWLIIVLGSWPISFFSLNYVQLLILSAPLFIIPLTFKNDNLSKKYIWTGLLFALLVAFSFWQKQGLFAGLSVLPWLVFSCFLLFKEIIIWRRNYQLSRKEISRLAAFIYLLIGAAWLMADRLDLQPLDFDPTIVLLTVAHFHFAGYILLIITSRILQFFSSKIMNWITVIVVAGVPLVAIGITSSHLDFPYWIETIAVIVMVSGGASVGLLHTFLGWRYKKHLFGWLWTVAGIALMGGMSLALLYGLRNIIAIPFLTIPLMYAVHGTLNAIGFALPAVSGWYLFYKKEKGITFVLS
jgi:hypothetical protein